MVRLGRDAALAEGPKTDPVEGSMDDVWCGARHELMGVLGIGLIVDLGRLSSNALAGESSRKLWRETEVRRRKWCPLKAMGSDPVNSQAEAFVGFPSRVSPPRTTHV